MERDLASRSMPAAFADPAVRRTIAVVRGVTQGSFFARYLNGVRSMAAEFGLEVAVHDSDDRSMAEAMNAALGQGADAVILSSGSLDPLQPAIDAALARGVPVLGLDMTGEHPQVPSLEQDDMWIGFLLSRKLAGDCNGQAKVVYVNPGGYAPLLKRDRSWQDFKWRYPGLQEVERTGAVTANTEAATKAGLLEVLRRHPEATAVFASWDEFARGAVHALRELGLGERVKLYSVDVSDEDIALMTAPGSPWVATVATDPANIGRVAARAAAALVAGERVERYLLIEPQLITQEFLRSSGVRTVDELVEAMPTLGESRLLWFDWMEELLARSGRRKPMATLEPDRLISLSNELRAANAALQQEIAERTRVEARLRFANLVLGTQQETSPDGILVVDDQGHVLSANRRFHEMWGLTAAEDRDQALLDAVRPRLVDPEGFLAEVRAIYADHERVTFDEVRLVGGVVLERFSAPMVGAAGEYQGRVWYYRDVTDRKRAEQALREADRRKDEFLAVLSHELRNPLAPIRNSIFLLERFPAGGERARHALGVIDRQTTHLTHLVDDLLDVTRITRGKLQLELARVELGAVVRRTAEDYEESFKAAGVGLELRETAWSMALQADATRIAQIVGNLLGNAVKFTPRGGRVEVLLEREGPEAVLHVCDNGIGIEPEVVERLFQPFSQAAQSLERARGGLGLGLALVRGLAELHGGTVSVRSEGKGRGAEFIVRLPLGTEPAEARAVAPAAAAPARPRKVLIIEDNVDAAESLQEMLALAGHDVHLAFDGPSGIAAARRLLPEVILCDIGLPGMDGYEVARTLRADPGLRQARLVALTGYALPEDRRRAQEAGFDHHVAKPPRPEVLDKILAE